MTKGVIFVTGVNGHIGNHIVADLLENGYSVKGQLEILAILRRQSTFMTELGN